MFGNLPKFSENVRKRSCGLRTTYRESSEIFGKWSENFRKSSKMSLSLCLCFNKIIHGCLWIWNISSYAFAAFTRGPSLEQNKVIESNQLSYLINTTYCTASLSFPLAHWSVLHQVSCQMSEPNHP